MVTAPEFFLHAFPAGGKAGCEGAAQGEENSGRRITSSAAFGKAIQKRRKDLKYTQEYISEVTGLSASFISNLENGKKTTELEKAIMLANVLGLDIDLSVRGQ